jgi:hypothetical protein
VEVLPRAEPMVSEGRTVCGAEMLRLRTCSPSHHAPFFSTCRINTRQLDYPALDSCLVWYLPQSGSCSCWRASCHPGTWSCSSGSRQAVSPRTSAQAKQAGYQVLWRRDYKIFVSNALTLRVAAALTAAAMEAPELPPHMIPSSLMKRAVKN